MTEHRNKQLIVLKNSQVSLITGCIRQMYGDAEAPRKRESRDACHRHLDGPGAQKTSTSTRRQAVAAHGIRVPARPWQRRLDAGQE